MTVIDPGIYMPYTTIDDVAIKCSGTWSKTYQFFLRVKLLLLDDVVNIRYLTLTTQAHSIAGLKKAQTQSFSYNFRAAQF
jgi:hypothetical protein